MSLTPLISFQDAVTASNLNPNQTHAVYYVDGAYANRGAVAARCPHARLYGITVQGRTGPGVFACDCEPGDLTIPQAVGWVDAQVRLGVPLICVYADYDYWINRGLLNDLAHYGGRVKRWLADYDNVPSIPGWADAKQFANPGPVDLNVALADFFGDAPPAVDPYAIYPTFVGDASFPNKGNERLTVEQADGALAQPVKFHDYLVGVVRGELKLFRDRIWSVAHGSNPVAWNDDRRFGVRWQGLNDRMVEIDALP